MLAIAFRFPAGRYHATPWGRHVNEADVEWPPSPWRILRALIATWHRKADHARYPEPLLEQMLHSLAASQPSYALPPAISAHSRHYMPVGRKPVLIFDAFVRVDPSAELVAAWPQAATEQDELVLLDALLRDIGFLGRAESWVEARRLTDWNGHASCRPLQVPDNAADHGTLEPVRLITPVSPQEYVAWRARIVETQGLNTGKLKQAQRRLLATLPETLLDALRAETGDLQQAGWSAPPGAQIVTYQRPFGCLTAQPRARPAAGHPTRTVTTARLALARMPQAGSPLPRIEDAVRIAEIARAAAMKKGERAGNGRVPPELSGHNLPAGNRHRHAFYLPEDADRDGHIDHVLIHAPGGLSVAALAAIDRIQRLWERDRAADWQALLEGYGEAHALTSSVYTATADRWLSVTPYLYPWFAKRGFGVAEQVARECRQRGLPEPQHCELVPEIRVRDGGRPRRPVHFRRFRSRRGLRQPDTRGWFLYLTFSEQIRGPLALGFGCHFGLGLFRPADDGEGTEYSSSVGA